MAGGARRRVVVISGAGYFSAWGDLDATWRALSRDGLAIARRELVKARDFRPFPGAPAAPEADPRPMLVDRKLAKYMSPTSKMAVVAAGRALESAGLLDDDERRSSLALYITTGLIAFDPTEVSRAIAASKDARGQLDMQRLGAEGLRLCHPLMPFKMLLNMPIGVISIAFGIRGDNAVNYPGSAQACTNLARARGAISSGRCDRVLVGAVSHGVSLMPLSTLERAGLLAADVAAAQPFGATHRGYAPADTSAFLLIEAEERARARGAAPMAVLRAVESGAPGEQQRTDARPADLSLVTGSQSAQEDEALAASASTTRLCSLDGRLGYAGPAAPFSHIALAARALAAQDTRPLALLGDVASPAAQKLYLRSSAGPEPTVERIDVLMRQGGEMVGKAELSRLGGQR